MKKLFLTLLLLLISISIVSADIVQRFPKPGFESGYERPELSTPSARSLFLEYMDVAVLILALSLASYFAVKQRSRRNIFLLMVLSLIYFGFYRKGCVCSVGSLQNVVYALFHSEYTIPLAVVLFFVIPLVFALFFGRTFCAAVCPLGAIQDAVVLKPSNVPDWLAQVLSIIPYIYLGLAVLFAATGTGFIICQYDPFVGFFRFGASFNMVLFGAFMLLLGTVIARPYCRFLCPYGVLLNWMSRLSKKHLSITPDECINCRLCETSCPFGAINKPVITNSPQPKQKSVVNLAVLIVAAPIVIFSTGWIGSLLHVPLSKANFTVSLAEEIKLEDTGLRTETTDETDTFRATGKSTVQLYNEANIVRNQFRIGGWFFGMFIGLIIMIKLINLSKLKKPIDYSADRGNCFSCGRCLDYCPVGREDIENSITEMPPLKS
jgi:NosR/NirI family transcriptional regulator, nitrous oxide reductase regulator